MVGDVINLAARLMGKAKGRIVCDEATYDSVSLVTCGDSSYPLNERQSEMEISSLIYSRTNYVASRTGTIRL